MCEAKRREEKRVIHTEMKYGHKFFLGEKPVSERKKSHLVTHYRPHSEGCGKVIFSLCPYTGVGGGGGGLYPSLWSHILSQPLVPGHFWAGAATPIRSKILPSLWSQVISRGYPMVSGFRSLP